MSMGPASTSHSDHDVHVDLHRLHPSQARVLAESSRHNVLMCGRRWGKTWLGVHIVARAALDGQPAAWLAPTYRYLRSVWRTLRRILAPVASRVSEVEHRIECMTGGSIDCWSLDDPDPCRGRRYAVAVFDEASLVRHLREAWAGAVRPALTDLRGRSWFLFTPRGRGYAHTLYLRGQSGDPEWRSWRLRTTDNPHMPAEEIESARHDMPDHVWRQEYEAEPADDGGNPFGLDAIRACIADGLSSAPPAVIGVDLGKYQDWTVIVGLDASGAVCLFDRFRADWGLTRERLAALGRVRMLIDSTGVGDPIVEDIARVNPMAEGFRFTTQSKQHLMEHLATVIHSRRVRYPDGPITDELSSYCYEYHSGGVRYSAPEGLHDDCVCALALAAWLLRRVDRAPKDLVRVASMSAGDGWDDARW